MELAFAGLHALCAPMLGRLAHLPSPQRDALSTTFGLSAGRPPDRFLVGLAVLSLVGVGRRALRIQSGVDAAIALFRAGSCPCAVETAGELIAFRVLQAVSGVMVLPIGFTLVAQRAGPQQVGRALAVLGLPVLLAPILGPILGGVIIDEAALPWLFVVNLPIAAVAIAAVALERDVRPVRRLDAAHRAVGVARRSRRTAPDRRGAVPVAWIPRGCHGDGASRRCALRDAPCTAAFLPARARQERASGGRHPSDGRACDRSLSGGPLAAAGSAVVALATVPWIFDRAHAVRAPRCRLVRARARPRRVDPTHGGGGLPRPRA
jgi:MFS family permease